MEVEETKIQLTHTENRHLPMDRVEAGLSVDLSRVMFEAAIDAQLERVRNSVTTLLNDAGVSVEQVNTVFFTGGSSGIPALRNSVSAM
ncbi:heat shock protein YegD, partial [Pseudomonas syringae pv. actinidiae ICMP 19070]